MEQLNLWPEEIPARARLIAAVRSRLEPHHGMHEAVWAERETPMPLEVFLVRAAEMAPDEVQAERHLSEAALWIYARKRDERFDVRATHVLLEKALIDALPLCLEAAGETDAARFVGVVGRLRTVEDVARTARALDLLSSRYLGTATHTPSYVAKLSARWAMAWLGLAREEIERGVVSSAGERSAVEMAAGRAAVIFEQAATIAPWLAFRSACSALDAARSQSGSVVVISGE